MLDNASANRLITNSVPLYIRDLLLHCTKFLPVDAEDKIETNVVSHCAVFKFELDNDLPQV